MLRLPRSDIIKIQVPNLRGERFVNMKTKAVIFALCAIILMIGIVGCDRSSGDSVSALTWLRDWDEAKKQAQEQDKPIMINCYTDVCPACRELDSKTFTDIELGAFLSDNFINLKSNANDSGLCTNYGVFGVPTTVFTEPDGEYIGEIRGYYPPKQFFIGVQEAVNRWENIAELGNQ